MSELIVLTGAPGSGKSALTSELEPQGWFPFTVSDHLRTMASAQDRAGIGELADEMVATYGPEVWCDWALQTYQQHKEAYPAGVILNGPRRVREIVTAQQYFDANVIYIKTAEVVSVARVQRAAQACGEILDMQQFKARRRAERLGQTSGGPDGINLRAIERLSGVVTIRNNVHISSLFAA
jgi:predicted ABC-type ATPase